MAKKLKKIKSTKKKAKALLSVYAQTGPGDCMCIVGSASGLEQLAAVIQSAIKDKKQSFVLEAVSPNNVPYDILVIVGDKELDKLAVPYTSADPTKVENNVIWPWDIIISRLPKY